MSWPDEVSYTPSCTRKGLCGRKLEHIRCKIGSIVYALPAEYTETVRSHIPGSVAIRTCSLPSKTRQSYYQYRFGKRARTQLFRLVLTTSSDMTRKLYSFASSAIFSSSALEKTFPTGLCGVLIINIFVRGVIARLANDYLSVTGRISSL